MKVIRKVVLVVVAVPVLAAVVGVFLGPTVLHPFVRRKMTAAHVRLADEEFRRLGGVNQDFNVRAPDGLMLRGWKVKAGASEQKKQIPRSARNDNGGLVGLTEV